MITETTSSLAPEQVLEGARHFFADGDSVSSANIVDESDRHVTMATFRSRLAISAWEDEDRVSTLRRNDAVGKFLTWVRTAEPRG
jgi:hypothetical protein